MTTDDRIDHVLRELARAEASRRPPAHLEAAVVGGFDRQRRQRGTYARRAAALIVVASVVAVVTALDMLVIRTPLPDRPPRALVDRRAELRPVPPPVDVEESWPDADLRASGGDDIAHLVRIRLPRAMLPTLGVPIIDPDAAGTVNVELLLGNDGLARTIRIVP